MKSSPFIISLFLLLPTIISLNTYAKSIKLYKDKSQYVDIRHDALYPEGLEYDRKRNKFVLGSIRKGSVHTVSLNGLVETLVDDERLQQVVGIRVDEKRNRLLVNSSDYGVGEKTDATKPKFSHIALGIYNLETGEPIQFIDLSNLRPNEAKFINDLDIDDKGNAYITDSLSATIYRVTPSGQASVFLTHEMFRGNGFNLNGIQYHSDGYLLVAKKSDGSLFKVPVESPHLFSQIELPIPLIGMDGLLLLEDNSLVVVTNRASGVVSNTVFHLKSEDNWKSAQIKGNFKTEDAYPTTVTATQNGLYVNYGYLNTLPEQLKQKKTLRDRFRLQAIGELK